MTLIDWALATERAVGHGSLSYADVINRPLRSVLTISGADPDAAFVGFSLVGHTHVTAAITDLATALTGITRVGVLASPHVTSLTVDSGGIMITAGDATLGGRIVFSPAAGKIVPGATSLSIRNHADSVDNLIITDAGQVVAGGAVMGAITSVFYVSKAVTALPAHAYIDVSTITPVSGNAYTSYDAQATLNGATAYDHHHAFQAANIYNGSGSVSARWAGFFDGPTHSGSGTIVNRFGTYISDVLITGGGGLTNNYGHYVETMSSGTNRWAYYAVSNDSYLGGHLTVGAGVAGAGVAVSGAAGTTRPLDLKTATLLRWRFFASAGAEAGANVGSNFGLSAYDDSGIVIDNPIVITRAAGGSIQLNRPVSVANSATSDGWLMKVGSTTYAGAAVRAIGGDGVSANNILYNVPTGGVHAFGIAGSGALTLSGTAITLGFPLVFPSAVVAASQSGTDVSLGASTQTTIGANGAASALTANPLGYLIAFKGATKIIIPYYNG